MGILVRFLVLFGAISLFPNIQLADRIGGDSGVPRTQSGSGESDSYDVLLHSQSLAEQRAALGRVLDHQQQYVPRIQQSLRDYPRLLQTDPIAARRAVYIS